MTVIGRLELPNKKGVLDQIHYYKNGKRLEKISFPDGRVSLSGFDGKIGWEVSSAGETSLHLGDEARTWARDADMHYPAHVLDYFHLKQRSIAEKRRIAELAMEPGASVAPVAREHGVNANMVHYWRSQYSRGRLGHNRADSVRLLQWNQHVAGLAPGFGPVPAGLTLVHV